MDFQEGGPMNSIWFTMLICNIVIPWMFLWSKKVRRTPWAMFVIGLFINIGMWCERFVIIPMSLTINRMPFTWRMYKPGIEVPLGIGTLAFFILLYMIASRLIPLVSVWEVQEGQMAHSLRKFGKESVVTVSDLD
jgi:molybdopterin-containing oxidoreductase family membrane subunit